MQEKKNVYSWRHLSDLMCKMTVIIETLIEFIINYVRGRYRELQEGEHW